MSTEDKENQSFEPHENTVKTPLKQSATSNLFLAEIQPAASCHLTTPPKPNEISSGDPWTPTANLKMLISAASPEIRSREQGKKLLDSRSEILEEHLSGDEYEKSQPSRKEKSLGLLCHKFLARYPSYPNLSKNNEICLDEVADELNVERRRIYDIMNVLESLHMVSRLAKNRYVWHGRHNLKRTLQILKKVAEENKYMQQIQLIKKRECGEEPARDNQRIDLMVKRDIPSNHMDISFVELPGMEFRGASVNSRKDKSLRVMSQKFVMLFLISIPQVVSLDIAAKILIGEDHVENLNKNKFKNTPSVLTPTTIAPAHLVEQKSSKEHCSKNLFPSRCKQGFTRHPSLIKLAKTTQSDCRKIRSAPSSPIRNNTGQIPSSFPSKMAQLAAICKQQLDEQSREFKKTKLKLVSSPLPCSLALPPESCLKSETFLLPSCVEFLPLTHSSASPPILPHIHSNVSYAVYVHPSQMQLATACNPSFMMQPVSCANVVGIKYPAETSSKPALGKMLTKGSDISLGESDTLAKDEGIRVAKKQEVSKDDCIPEKFLKRCQVVPADSPIKKSKSEEVTLQDMLQTWIPSSYLIPLSQCTQLGNETADSNKGKSEMCLAEKKSYSSPADGGIPVTSDFKAVNFPAFHITPLNLTLPPSSVSTVPVVNHTVPDSEAHSNLMQAPSSSVLNFTLHHMGQIPTIRQMSSDPGLGSAHIHQGEECVSSLPRNVDLKEGKASLNVLLEHGHELNGKPVLTVLSQQTTAPITSRISQEGNENVFYIPSKPAPVPSSSSSAPESNVDGISQGTLLDLQRELDASTD
ncbi:transcription factor E2F8 isoform X2 [Eublepharis macularius]|uniref:Transcription factor E2F8 n=1 Tax=Eublepharis macularius TaxID=481883 RepID=A0AA97IY05_EUBMA|nr:transcription factor E2F8 isoform X2 [Eublepharis macularius]